MQNVSKYMLVLALCVVSISHVFPTLFRFCRVFMVTLWNRADHYIFAPWFLLILSIFFSSPNLSRRRLDVYHTSTHGVALVRI